MNSRIIEIRQFYDNGTLRDGVVMFIEKKDNYLLVKNYNFQLEITYDHY